MEIRMPDSSTLPATLAGPRIGLALGGGGARGLAHIVVLEALEELGLKPTVIAGTSIGALLGAAAAAGLPARHLRAHVEELMTERYGLVRQLFSARAPAIERLFSLVPIRSAILDADALLDLILPSRVPSTFEALAVPLAVVTTDFYAQETIVLRSGDLRHAIAASIALPVIFQPVIVQGRACLDGGLVDPLPFELVREGSDITIAVDVSGATREPDTGRGPGALEALFSSSQILQRSIVREKLKSNRPDILLDHFGEGVGVLEFHRFREIMASAEPAKDVLKRQIDRVFSAETVRPGGDT
jgi:NTE family protein